MRKLIFRNIGCRFAVLQQEAEDGIDRNAFASFRYPDCTQHTKILGFDFNDRLISLDGKENFAFLDGISDRFVPERDGSSFKAGSDCWKSYRRRHC